MDFWTSWWGGAAAGYFCGVAVMAVLWLLKCYGCPERRKR